MHDKIKVPNSVSHLEYKLITILHNNKPRKIPVNERLKWSFKNPIKANLPPKENKSLEIPSVPLRRQNLRNHF